MSPFLFCALILKNRMDYQELPGFHVIAQPVLHPWIGYQEVAGENREDREKAWRITFREDLQETGFTWRGTRRAACNRIKWRKFVAN